MIKLIKILVIFFYFVKILCNFCLMTYDENRDVARMLARRLLEEPAKLVSDRFDGIRTVGVDVRDALDSDRIPNFLREIAPSAAEQDDLFGHGDVPVEFEISRVRRALRLLADTGLRDVAALRRGGEVLDRIIGGLHQQEEAARRGIAPDAAAEAALINRAFRRLCDDERSGSLEGVSGDDLYEWVDQMRERMQLEGDTELSPNDLDEAQQSALLDYQKARYCRIALEKVYAGLGSINRELEREGPDHLGQSWSLGQ